jgi:hypothetical protein
VELNSFGGDPVAYKKDPGKLPVATAPALTTQQQVYKVLRAVSELDSSEKERLRLALAQGPEHYWISQALQYGQFEQGTASRKRALDELAENGSQDHLYQVLGESEGLDYRPLAMRRLGQTPEGACSALLHVKEGWTTQETDIFLDLAFPVLTSGNAAALLGKDHVRKASHPRRLGLLMLATGGTAGFVCIGILKADAEKTMPKLTQKERARVVEIFSKDGHRALDAMFPNSADINMGRRPSNTQSHLTQKEKEVLAEVAATVVSIYPRRTREVEAQELLANYSEHLSLGMKEKLRNIVK